MSGRGKKSSGEADGTTRKEDRIALDRLKADQKAQDEAERKRREEIARWNVWPTCAWTTYFIILAVLSPIVFVFFSYVPFGPPDGPREPKPWFFVAALWVLVSVLQFQVLQK